MRFGARGKLTESRLRGPLAALLCVTALGLAACGGSDDSSDQLSDQEAAEAKAVLAVGEQLQKGYQSKDSQAVCRLMDPVGLKKHFGGQNGCVKRLNAAFNQTDQVPDLNFENVTVNGNTAVATADPGDGSNGNTVYFTQINGEWKIDLDQNPSTGQSSSDSSKDQ